MMKFVRNAIIICFPTKYIHARGPYKIHYTFTIFFINCCLNIKKKNLKKKLTIQKLSDHGVTKM